MLNRYLKCCIFACISFYTTQAQSQPRKLSKDTIVYVDKRIKTDVFILNTCDPSQVSMRRKYDNDSFRFSPNLNVRRLAVASSRLSSFKIEGINPMRYKYYINSEAVTQFMDPTAQSITLNNFIKDGFFLTAPEINIPKIFKEEIEPGLKRKVLVKFRQQLDFYRDSMDRVNKVISDTYLTRNTYAPYNDSLKKYKQIDNKASTLNSIKRIDLEQSKNWNEFDRLSEHISDLFGDYEQEMSALPITNGNIALLTDYRNKPDSEFSNVKSISEIEIELIKFIQKYDKIDTIFKTVDSLLSEYGDDRLNPLISKSDEERIIYQLGNLMRSFNYSIRLRIRSDERNSQKNIWEIIRIKEFMQNKRYQEFEEFTMNIAAKIGIMLQNYFRQYSQEYNALLSNNCLDDSVIYHIKPRKDTLIKVFDFVQRTSTQLQLLVEYLEVDNKTYASIAKGINANYWYLLTYLKTFDFIRENNMVEYTLPTSTNLRNVDLIRYKVDREDKITGGKQSYVYDFWLKGGLKIDFSIGIFATGLADHQFQKFQYDSVGRLTDSVQINKSDNGGYSFGFGGMVNIAPRVGSSWLNVGGSFGVIYSSNQKLQFLAGLSLHLGKTERIILHGGATIGFIQTIDKSKNEIREVSKGVYRVKADVNNFNIPTIERFSVRPFLGISYNLSKKNALQAISNEGLKKYNNALSGDEAKK
jgi:hypothetical protein